MPSPQNLLVGALMAAALSPNALAFELEEATIAGVHAAFKDRTLTCESLVQRYLDRIEAYNAKGPALHAILTVNPNALDEARQRDQAFAAQPEALGSLHCVPIVLKDNFDTADMPTSSGNVAMKDSRPQHDAFTVARMRQAGAIILAKSNLQEFARGGVSISSLGGQVLNPYDLSRNPGGSSGGTGAALAANMALVGTGSDTGQSIRSPASANSLVGVRPTRGLISRQGVMPNSFTQDEIGPIGRTVTDTARLLDVMVGFDPRDPVTALGVGEHPASYVAALDAGALKGAKIGLLTNLMGGEARHAEVNQALRSVAAAMQQQGATVVEFRMDDLADLTRSVATDAFEARAAFESYFQTLPEQAPVRSFAQLIETRTASPAIQATLEKEFAIEDGMQSAQYRANMLNREKLKLALLGQMAQSGFDAILYPMQSILVTEAGRSDQPERNGVLSNGTGMPAVTFPAGFSAPTSSAPIGVPIGAELLGRDFSEARLLGYAYALEQAAPVRKPPVSTPPLK